MRPRRRHVVLGGFVLATLVASLVAAVAFGPLAAAGVALVAALGIAYVLYNSGLDVLWMPTAAGNTERLLAMAEIRPTDLVVDLGCGDARLLVEAARLCGARGRGVEIDPIRVAIARVRILLAGERSRVTVTRGDVRRADLARADVVYLYLNPDLNAELRPKLERELRPGVRVISNCHEVPLWKADRTEPSTTPGETLWLYTR